MGKDAFQGAVQAGLANLRTGELEESAKDLLDAVRIAQNQGQSADPDFCKHASPLSAGLVELANRFTRSGDCDSALRLAEDAVSITDTCARQDPSTFAPQLAHRTQLYAILTADCKTAGAALEVSFRALDLWKSLNRESEDRFTAEQGIAHVVLANALEAHGRVRQASDNLVDALPMLRESRVRQTALASTLTSVLTKLGSTRIHELQYGEAGLLLTEASLELDSLAPVARVRHEPDVAGQLIQLAIKLILVDHLDEAAENLLRAKHCMKLLPEEDQVHHSLLLGDALTHLGVIRNYKGRLDEAISLHRDALALVREQTSQEHARLALRAAANLGDSLTARGQTDEAVHILREACSRGEIDARRDPMILPQLLNAYTNLGTALKEVEQHETALACLADVLARLAPLHDADPDEHSSLMANALNATGLAQLALGKFPEALAAFSRASSLRRSKAGSRPREERGHVITEVNLAIVLRRMHRTTEAIEVLARAESLARRLLGKDEHQYADVHALSVVSLVDALLEQARLVEEQLATANQADEALPSHASAIVGNEIVENVVRAEGLLREVLSRTPGARAVGIALAHVLHLRANFAESREGQERLLREALGLLDGLAVGEDESNLRISVLAFLANVLADARVGGTREAVGLLERAVGLIEHARGAALSLSARREVMRRYQHVFERLAWLQAVRLERVEDAIVAIERSRTRLLADAMTRAQGGSSQGDETSELVDRYWRALVQAEQASRTSLHDSLDAQRERDRLEAYRQALEEVRAAREALQSRDPDFLPAADPLDLTGILRVAREANTTLVYTLLSEEDTLLFLIHPTGEITYRPVYQFGRTAWRDALQLDWEEPYTAFLDAANDPDLDPDTKNAAHANFLTGMDRILALADEKFVQHVRSVLTETGGKRVTFIPHRELAGLPLHAAWREDEDEEGRPVRRYLADDAIVTYTPSGWTLARTHARTAHRQADGPTLALINPIPPGGLHDALETRDTLTRTRSNLHAYSGQHARGGLLFSDTARNASLLHLDCHGRFDPTDPLKAHLELAGGTDPNGKPYTESITLADLLEDATYPRAWHATITACESSLTNLHTSSGEPLSLAYAFLLKGTPSTWSSLWSSEHTSTVTTLTHAYHHLTPHTDKATLLHHAQHATRTHTTNDGRHPYTHPYYWATLQHHGS